MKTDWVSVALITVWAITIIGCFIGAIVTTIDQRPTYIECPKSASSCRIQTCARLVVSNGVATCEEWKP